MPLGDSITYGFNGINYPNGSIPGGYRRQLGIRLANAGDTYDFVGTSSANSAVGMDPNHNGFGGIRTDQVLAKLSTWLTASPDIVLMHLGTNDLIQHVPLSTLASNLGSLIQKITVNAPNRKLFVATIIPIIDTRDGYTAAQWVSVIGSYNVQVRNLVQQYASQGRQVFLVEVNAGLVYTATSSINKFFQPGDGTHPGQAGYNQMGDMWFNAIHSKDTPVVPDPVTPAVPVPGSLLANGSFESGFNNWVATGNQTIATGAPYAASNGVRLVSFNGGNLPANASLSQTFATNAGRVHTLAFDLGVLPYSKNPQSLLVTVTGSGTLLTKTIGITGIGNGSIRWTPQTFTFTANSASTSLIFRDRSITTNSIDMLLDNVRVTGAPGSGEIPPDDPEPPSTPGTPGDVVSLLANGSFEAGFSTWLATGNQTIATGAPYAASNGVSLVSFNGGNLPANASLSQTFATTKGQVHTLAFDLGVLAYNKNSQSMLVTVIGNGILLTETIGITGGGNGTIRWAPQTFTFTANSASTTLTFRDRSITSNYLDMLLDNVWVSRAPAPAAGGL